MREFVRIDGGYEDRKSWREFNNAIARKLAKRLESRFVVCRQRRWRRQVEPG